MTPKFELDLTSKFYIRKLPKSFINELSLDVNINYVIDPQLSLDIKSPIESFTNYNVIFSKRKHEFHTEISIGNVAKIPGKITFYDFGISSIEMYSRSTLSSTSPTCTLNGKIHTGFIFINEKFVHNFGEGILKYENSCEMKIEWSKFSLVKIQFSFKVAFEWDKRNEMIYSNVLAESINVPISQWLYSKILNNFEIYLHKISEFF